MCLIVPVKANITLEKSQYGVGEEISIPCNVDGYPIPRVQWLKDEEPIQPSVRLNITGEFSEFFFFFDVR